MNTKRKPGRPRKPDKKLPVNVKVSPEVKRYLDAVDNRSLTIESAIRRSKGFRDFTK